MDIEGRIRSYELRQRIGAGGFGVVYRAFQPAVGRDVAIKVILPEHANQPDFVRRFEVEAQLIARLEHPHIVPLYDYWRDPQGAYLVMRWLPTNLHTALHGGAWTLEATARLLEQIAGALTMAHREGVIHRDIKPDNILLDEDENAYLADFGIAQDTNLARSGAEAVSISSPTYSTPEQIKGEAVTVRTDIYSLGFVIYEMLVNEKPYPDATTPEALMSRHLNTPLPLIGSRRPNLPAAIDEVLQTATAKNPEQRYANALRFAAAFRAALPNLQRVRAQPLAEPLTGRELDILRLIVTGLSNDEIAERLVLSRTTIKWYTRQIYSKLDVHSRHQAIERAEQLKLLGGHAAAPEFAPDRTVAAEVARVDADTSSVALTPDLFNPYKGLRAFQETDASTFFGRAALTEQLLSHLASSGGGARFLALVGPSGSGKSSVVKAGLIPALRRGGLNGSARWFITDMLPGAHPFEELEAALLRVAVNPLPGILDQLSQDRRGLVRAVKRTLPSDGGVELVLVIDQFEELFTLVSDETLRTQFIDNLLSAVTDPRGRVRIILTLRADFYDRPLVYPRLAELMRSHAEVIVPLNAAELERAIVGPAEKVGLTFETGLVATMLKDVGEQPGTLPLLEYALAELYERRQDRLLTQAAYRELGGISGALARRADDLYEALDETEQDTARQMFLRLITLGEGVEDTRRRVLQTELASLMSPGASEDLIEVFSQYRLLTLDRDPLTRGPTVEIAHEALIREWGRLREWLRESREALRIQRRLMAGAGEWIQSERDVGFLATGARLTQFEALAAEADIRLNQEEGDYLTASVAAQEQAEQTERQRQAHEVELARQAAKSQRQSANRLRYLVSFLALFLVIAAVLSLVALNSRADAVAKGQLADANAATSQANFLRSEAQRLAAESNNLRLRGGNSELIALLALRAINLQYTPQGDEALTNASFLDLPVRVFNVPHQQITDVDFAPDDKTFVVANFDHTASVWDMATGQEIHTLSGHTDIVYRARFSPDGTQIVTASFDQTLRLWDADTGAFVRAFVGHTAIVSSVIFSPDGKTIASGSDDETIRLWDVATGQQIRQFEGSVYPLALSPDGKTLLAGGVDKFVRLWDVQSGEKLREVNVGASLYSAAFSHDGTLFVTGSDDLVVRVWDTASATVIRQLKGHTNNLRVTVFSQDDQTILSSSDDNTMRLWDVATGQELRDFYGHANFVWGAAFSHDGRFALSGSWDGTVKLWDLQRNPNVYTFDAHAGPVSLAVFAPDAAAIVTGSTDGTARMWDAATGAEIRQFADPADTVITALAVSPDGQRILTSHNLMAARLWDALSGQELYALPSPGEAQNQNVAFSPDGRYALVGDGIGIVHLMDVETWMEVRRFIGHSQQIFSVAYAPDGKTVFTGTFDGTARLWDVATGQQIRQFDLSSELGGNSTAYSPDGKLLAAGTWGGSVYIWDFATGDQIQRLLGHNDQVNVVFSPDGKYLLSGGGDGTLRLWDVQTWQEVRRLVVSGYGSGTFAPNSRVVLNFTGQKSAELVPVDYHVIVQQLCEQLSRDLSDDERAKFSIVGSDSTCPADMQSGAPPTWTPIPTQIVPVWTPLAPIAPLDGSVATPEIPTNP